MRNTASTRWRRHPSAEMQTPPLFSRPSSDVVGHFAYRMPQMAGAGVLVAVALTELPGLGPLIVRRRQQ